MNTQKQISEYFDSQPEPKRSDMVNLHRTFLDAMPECKVWFLDGRNADGKIVSNPSVGYGSYELKYANGKSREFYQIGLSANTSGISVYVMGIEDKKYLADTFGKTLGKASVTGYCVKFKALKDINSEVLLSAVRAGLAATDPNLNRGTSD